MAELTAQTTFTIAAAQATFTESADITLLPENAGVNAMRELHYPGDVYPPLVYPDFPDETTNFDSTPLTARPALKTERTIAGTKTAVWRGYQGDFLVQESWKGSDKISRMTTYYLRRLIEYYFNPPASGYITWIPKDQGDDVGYFIRIFSLTVGGTDIRLVNMATINSLVVNEIVLSFEIVGVAS
jgi:hypothetical protein